jgi:diguanylate cyclase (GGDEF)-like protein/PAS domain S-box-containing protein
MVYCPDTTELGYGADEPAPGTVSAPVVVARETLERYENAFTMTTIGMAIVALDGHFLQVNPALCEIVGYSADELNSMTFQDITHPDDLAYDLEQVQRLIDGSIGKYQIEKRYLHRSGDAVWIELSVTLVRNADGEPSYFIAQMQDITARRALDEQLRHQAFHDPLTGLPNRGLFVDRLEHALGRAERAEETLAVLFLDLDNFKLINDSLGHRAGDKLLQTMATRLQHCVRPGDTVARLGGDEFTILLENIAGAEDAVRVAQRVAEQSLTLYAIGDRQVAVTASIGIALSSPERSTPDDLIRAADTAMYEAKRRGRSRYELYSPRMQAHASDRLEMEIALQRALERGEFILHYQPVVDLTTGRINEVEALVRWNSPERGLVQAEDFIAIAEEAGIAAGIGDWVLRSACRQLYRWQRDFPADKPLTMSVNLSTRQFLQATLVDDVRAVLRSSGVRPETLKLEITERAVMEDAATTTEMLRDLKELGVTLAIDDFGTGYSSLSYLTRFAVDILKIDRGFVAGIGRSAEDTAIVEAVIAIARTLGISTIAEGIETAEQLDHLRRLRCDCGQGHFFAPPLPASGIADLLHKQAGAQMPPLNVTQASASELQG